MDAAPLAFDLPGTLAALADEPLDPANTGAAALQALRDLLPCPAALVAFGSGPERALLRRVALGIEPRDPAASEVHVASDPIVERIVLSGEPLHIHDYGASSLRDPHLAAQGVAAVAAAPVVRGGRADGAVVAFRRAGEAPFVAADLRRLAEAGRLIGLVLSVHEARSAHARGAARERLLASAIAQAAVLADVDESLAALARGAREIAGAPFAAILLDADAASGLHGATPGPLLDALAARPRDASPPLGLSAVLDGGLDDGRPFAVLEPRGVLQRLGWSAATARTAVPRASAIVALPLTEAGVLVGALIVLVEGASPDSAAIGPLQVLGAHAASLVRNARLRGEVEEAYLATVTALANALEAKHHDTHEHASATRALAVAVGRRMGLDQGALRDLGFAAALHDVGKIALPDSILEHDGPLDDVQWALVREHTVLGERILQGTPFLRGAARAVRSAHERWDGGGYPDGLAGEEIPLLARIVFACDTWDVMTSDRPYRKALDRPEALRRLREAAGGQLDPLVVGALLDVVCGAAANGEALAVRRGGRPAAA